MQTGFILLVGLWAGLQNALAGGGTFVTLPALILSGMTPLAANITSTVALFQAKWPLASLVIGWRVEQIALLSRLCLRLAL
jgi:biotin transporter BioY